MKSRVARLAVFLFILMLQAKDGNPAAFDRNQPIPDSPWDLVRNHRHLDSSPSTVPDSEPVQFVPSKVKDTTQMNERDSMDGEQWSCQICTFLNDGDMTKCSMCDTRAPKKTRDWHNDIKQSSARKTRDLEAFNEELFPNDSTNPKTRTLKTKEIGSLNMTPLNIQATQT
eukprot:606811_1